MPEIVTLGETMAVLYPPDPVRLDDTAALKIDIGGAESNLAIALCRLGLSARFISKVGGDPFGARIRSTLEREGVDTAYLLTDPAAPTGVFFREWLPDGERRVYYYRKSSAASQLAPADLTPEMFSSARLLHLTGITPALGGACAETVVRAAQLAKQAGALVSFDPNYRARLWSPAQAREALLPIMRLADIILLGHEDAAAVLGTTDEQESIAASHACGAGLVVLKLSERGAIASEGGRQVAAPAEFVESPVDPVGAGDGFNAGFLAARLRGRGLEEALRMGAHVGAACVATLGDYAGYPRIAQW
ncbi:sugar kinase [Chloroflexia bacterium SDU3-3]|nr:sugar kinase [Chloroflexia bacterium SDU3-3]